MGSGWILYRIDVGFGRKSDLAPDRRWIRANAFLVDGFLVLIDESPRTKATVLRYRE